jgi:hypothetical protein
MNSDLKENCNCILDTISPRLPGKQNKTMENSVRIAHVRSQILMEHLSNRRQGSTAVRTRPVACCVQAVALELIPMKYLSGLDEYECTRSASVWCAEHFVKLCVLLLLFFLFVILFCSMINN